MTTKKLSADREFAALVATTEGVSHSIRFLKKDRVWLLRLDSVVLWSGMLYPVGRTGQAKRQEFKNADLQALFRTAIRWIKRHRRGIRSGKVEVREDSHDSKWREGRPCDF